MARAQTSNPVMQPEAILWKYLDEVTHMMGIKDLGNSDYVRGMVDAGNRILAFVYSQESHAIMLQQEGTGDETDEIGKLTRLQGKIRQELCLEIKRFIEHGEYNRDDTPA
jgi:hypothetical protein